MRIAVVGASGQLGAELCRQLGPQAIPLSRPEFDVLDAVKISRRLAALLPEVVINAASYTAVDQAETDREACFAVNAAGSGHLAAACRAAGCDLLQVSTDYIFGADQDRRTPYREDEAPGPVQVYGESKLAGEVLVAENPRHWVVRTAALFGRPAMGMRGNFVATILRLAAADRPLRVVNDQFVSPSSARDVAAAIIALIQRQAPFGVYHVVNSGSATWWEFAREILRRAGLDAEVQPITTAEYAAPAKRPAYSVLDASKLQSVGLAPLPHWRDALQAYLSGD